MGEKTLFPFRGKKRLDCLFLITRQTSVNVLIGKKEAVKIGTWKFYLRWGENFGVLKIKILVLNGNIENSDLLHLNVIDKNRENAHMKHSMNNIY